MVFFQFQTNEYEVEELEEMSEATLPLVTIASYDNTVAQLHGYIKEMDEYYIRDALVPLDDSYKMDITVDTYGYEIDSISYELQTIDQSRKIASNTLEDWETSEDSLFATVQVANLVTAGEEYFFTIIIEGEGQTLYYYTRITYPDMENLSDCIDFAVYFHETALSDDYSELSTYIEPSDYVDQDTLADVTIESSLDQIGWSDFAGTVSGDVVVQLSDVGNDYVSLTLFYQMEEPNGAQLYYYTVEEYFKLRYTSERIYLIDYQRSMEQILTKGCVAVSDNTITVGICCEDMEYLSSENGSILAFVQAGELYQYNQNKQTLTKVYGFIDDVTDPRQTFGQHEIRILSVDENGNMDFVVFGYMNRGDHEGDCGINLFHYDNSSRQVVEQLFISSTEPYEVLKASFSNLLYENVSGDFFIILGGTLAKVGTDTVVTEDIVTGLTSDQYAVSESGRYVAWTTSDVSDSITVMDLESETTRVIEAPEGCYLTVIDFMTEDFVYGVIDEEDIYVNDIGSTTYPIYQINIVDATTDDFEVMKTYEKDGIWVVDVEKSDSSLQLERVKKDSSGRLVSTDTDVIKDSSVEDTGLVERSVKVDSDKGSVTCFTMVKTSDSINSISTATATMAVDYNFRSMSVEDSNQHETYFVYVGSHITLATQNLTKAIALAYDEMGMVIDNQQRYIWKRGKSVYVNTIRGVQAGENDLGEFTAAGCLSALLAWHDVDVTVHNMLLRGDTPLDILESKLSDKLILDLTGCTLEQALYYVSQGGLVYVSTGETTAYLINGYDSSTVVVYNTETDKYVRLDQDEAEELFENNGNCFIAVVE